MNEDLLQLGNEFQISGEAVECEAYGTGHIHDTYLLRTDNPEGLSAFILQRFNIDVFQKPESVQDNIFRITSFLNNHPDLESDYEDLQIVDTRDGRSMYIDGFGNHWRCFPYMDNTLTYDSVGSPEIAYEGARGFGYFVSRLRDYNPRRLHITIPNFMDVEWRTQQLAYTEFTNPGERLKEVQPELKKLRRLSDISKRYLRIRTALPERVTHNDTKISNILFDEGSGKGRCIIDLDTVMSGTLLTDFGDMVRSYTSSGREDQTDPGTYGCREEIFESLVEGFASSVSDIIHEVEVSNLLLGAELVIYMQAIRFITDYIRGDVYYKVDHPQQNLDRTRNQIGLLDSVLDKKHRLKAIIKERF